MKTTTQKVRDVLMTAMSGTLFAAIINLAVMAFYGIAAEPIGTIMLMLASFSAGLHFGEKLTKWEEK